MSEYSRNQAISVLEQSKIITPEVCLGSSMTYDENNYYHNSKCHTLLINPESDYTYKSILPIINSKLFWFFILNTGNVLRGGYVGVKRKVLEPFPIPVLDKDCLKKFEKLSEQMLDLNNKRQLLISRFNKYVKSQYINISLNQKLENWYYLNFNEFIRELCSLLKKYKIDRLRKKDEIEWMELFENYKCQILTIQTEIDRTDKKIDEIVYEIYSLSPKEIEIVEKSVQ